MIIEPVPWHNNREICPADFDFIEYLKTISQQRIFHMGPGYDHIVARRTRHIITAITHCPGELSSYMSLAIRDIKLAMRYQVLFGDLHLLDRYMLGDIDMASLFHLGELSTSDGASVNSLISTFHDVPIIALYTGSFAFSVVEPIILSHRYPYSSYKSIKFYGV